MPVKPKPRFQVFVSSTYRDLSEIRTKIIEQLFKMNCIPVGMEMFPATNKGSWELIQKVLDDSDYVVVILARNYGTPDNSGVGFTEKEFDYANATKKQILVFREELTKEELETLEKPMRDFREKVAIGRQLREWRTITDLLIWIGTDLGAAITSEPQQEGWVRGGYAMDQHVSFLNTTFSTMTSNLETKLSDVSRIHKLSETMNARIDAILSLATEERRGTRAMGHYMHIQQLKLDLAASNPMFATVADGLIWDPFETLANLARAHASVPSYQIGHANELLLSAIKTRFDAASHDDIHFWQSEDQADTAYRRVIRTAIQRDENPIIATRIFVLPLQVIIKQRDDVESVLADQLKDGIHWAIAVEEDEKPYRQVGLDKPDFALFDQDRAISYFRKERRFDVTFNTHGRSRNGEERNGEEAEIEFHMRAYRTLLTHCWLATEGFAKNHLATHDESPLLARVKVRINQLRDLKFEHAERLLPLQVSNATEIRGALHEMLELRSRTLPRR